MPYLGEGTVDARKTVEHDASTSNKLNDKSQYLRLTLTHDGERDEMQMKQPKHASILKEDVVIQLAFRFSDKDTENNETLEWCTGKIVTAS